MIYFLLGLGKEPHRIILKAHTYHYTVHSFFPFCRICIKQVNHVGITVKDHNRLVGISQSTICSVVKLPYLP